MKYTFITAKSKIKPRLPAGVIKSLPDKLALFVTVQFRPYYEELKNQLEKQGKQVISLRPPHSIKEGQLLGCGIKEFKQDFDAFLYVGDGAFHPLTLLIRNAQPVICYDPFTKKKSVLTKKDVEYALKREKAGYVMFLSSERIGVILSLKPGQNRKRLAMMLREQFPDKSFYFFVCDQLDFNQLDNFPFVQVWVNTACPRIMIDDVRKFSKPVINIEALLELHLPEGTKIPPR